MLSILFVEDDATIAMGVEYSLKQDGFQVSLAYRLEEARDLLKRQPFDLVLLGPGICRMAAATRCARRSAPPGIRPSSSFPPATKRPASSSASTWARTTTSPSPSACAS